MFNKVIFHQQFFLRHNLSLPPPHTIHISKSRIHAWVWNTYPNLFFLQLQQFRNVKEEDEGESPESLVDNFRPVQPLHGRVLEISGNSARALGPTMVMVGLAAMAFLY